MEYLIGTLLAPTIALLATAVGLARERSFFPTVMIVIATYYVLFATMGGSGSTLWVESAVALGFIGLAVIGFQSNLWWVAAALVGHGVFDIFHHRLIDNPAVPSWWPGFCLTVDVILGAVLAARLLRDPCYAQCANKQPRDESG